MKCFQRSSKIRTEQLEDQVQELMGKKQAVADAPMNTMHKKYWSFFIEAKEMRGVKKNLGL